MTQTQIFRYKGDDYMDGEILIGREVEKWKKEIEGKYTVVYVKEDRQLVSSPETGQMLFIIAVVFKYVKKEKENES